MAQSSANKNDIGDGWAQVRISSERVIVQCLNYLYWEGIDRDLDEILRTLNLHLTRNGANPKASSDDKEDWGGTNDILERLGADLNDTKPADVPKDEKSPSASRHRLARLLLQATGMLDIDKIVEHRDLGKDQGAWVRPRAAQRTSSPDDLMTRTIALRAETSTVSGASTVTTFSPLKCKSCLEIIRGTQFMAAENDGPPSEAQSLSFCESCAHLRQEDWPSNWRKRTKHCVLGSSLSAEQTRQTCRCGELGSDDLGSQPLYPFNRRVRSAHSAYCPLARLKSDHCQRRLSEVELESERRRAAALEGSRQPAPGSTGRAVGKKVPYGKVHMSLMVGPLIIEKSAIKSQGCALVTVRDRLQLHPTGTMRCWGGRSYAVRDGGGLVTRKQTPQNRRVKACMKQVVGSPFWGLGEDQEAEADIVNDLVKAAEHYRDDPTRDNHTNGDIKRRRRVQILYKLRKLLQDRVQIYIISIVNKLLDRDMARYSPVATSMAFCERLIDRHLFGSFMVYPRTCMLDQRPEHPSSRSSRGTKNHGSKQSLYLLSFVSRAGCHDGLPKSIFPPSKLSQPNGHIEEYMLQYRHRGSHDTPDVVDSLAEYWTDWAGFRKPIYRYQPLFPWDCTEARSKEDGARDHVKCGKCSLAKHVWAFPFDSWSIIQLHLFRDRRFYTPRLDADAKGQSAQMGDAEWLTNRLQVLEAMQALGRIAVAMHSSRSFRQHCKWNFVSRELQFPWIQPVMRRFFVHPAALLITIVIMIALGLVNLVNGTNPPASFFDMLIGLILGLVVSCFCAPCLSRKFRVFKAEKRSLRLAWINARAGKVLHDRVKLAGIHRAQPKSHAYEQRHGGVPRDCTLADWADLRAEDQIAAYEEERDARSVDLDGIIQRALLARSTGFYGSGGRVGGRDHLESRNGVSYGQCPYPAGDSEEWDEGVVGDGWCDGSEAEVRHRDTGNGRGCECIADPSHLITIGLSDFTKVAEAAVVVENVTEPHGISHGGVDPVGDFWSSMDSGSMGSGSMGSGSICDQSGSGSDGGFSSNNSSNGGSSSTSSDSYSGSSSSDSSSSSSNGNSSSY
ncbi:hypothetical protein PspLS_09285 [Pyricularia sp. CBS 133598]|nr:hypothetical protein PspLS_09285 [Pyricularia sp. CBS 133598]